MSTITSSPLESTPAIRSQAPAPRTAAPATQTSEPAGPTERTQLSAPEPPASAGASTLAAGLQGNFGGVPAQSLEIDLPRHTQARLAHTAARINDPATTPAQRRDLLREQAQLRAQQNNTQHRTQPPTRHELPSAGAVLDCVRSVTGDLGPVGSAQRLRVATTDPNLTPAQRGSAIGGEVAGVTGGKVAAGAGMVRGAALGARLGLQGGATVGMAVAGPPGAFVGGLAGAAGGTVIGGAAGWLLGNSAGDAAARPVGSAAGGALGERLGR